MREANLKLADNPGKKVTKKGTETKNLGQKMQLLRKALLEQTAIYMAILFLARLILSPFPLHTYMYIYYFIFCQTILAAVTFSHFQAAPCAVSRRFHLAKEIAEVPLQLGNW